MKIFRLYYLTCIYLLLLFTVGSIVFADTEETIVIYGEFPVVEEIEGNAFADEGDIEREALIRYDDGIDYREKALIEAVHFLSANIYGYTFFYKPASILMKTEEIFEIELKGKIREEQTVKIGEGVYNNVYRIKLGLTITPSIQKWLNAFHSNKLRLTDAEGTSDFFSGFSGRSEAYREALRNLVLVAAKKRLSSKPLSIKGDILLKNNPSFSVGAGRYYCKIKGFVNFVEVITYD